MKFPEIFPPNDLLKQVEGIESGLRQRQRLGLFGVAAAVVQIFVLFANHEWFLNLLQGNWTELFTAHWRALSILGGVIVCLVLATWAHFWIQESQEPFRYTCSIADFAPILPDKADGPKEDRLSVQLSHDLTERLNERIKRLYLLDEKEVKAEPAGKDERQAAQSELKRKSHVHVRGYYVIRKKPDGAWFIEVMPRVRIGPVGSPEKLAHPVKFKLLRDDSEEQATSNNGTAASLVVQEDAPPKLTARQYEQILERVYFSIATEIYKQIQEDVKRKIQLLPTDYFRAVALFHEAEDYANSNTLDAYADATKLYDQALSYFDPDWKPLSTFTPWRIAQRVSRWLANRWLRTKSRLTAVWPRLGRIEIMRARAEMGYANMLVYRRTLARLSGQRSTPSFEAPRVAQRSVERVRALSADLPERLPRLFEAYVTLALAQSYVTAVRAAKRNLAEARALDPVRAENDSRYLFAVGEIEPRTRSKVNFYRRAVELDPRFEVAQFSEAYQIEMLWRTRPSLERSAAEAVLREYEEVVKVNPGNVGAWANNGYVRWLLATAPSDFRKARQAFEDGRDYKEIKHETFVAELDYGLARIAAEQGDFDRAYNHYINGVSAMLAQGMNFNGLSGLNTQYFYGLINHQLLKRFEKYKTEVETNFKVWGRLVDEKWETRQFSEVVSDLKDASTCDASGKGIAVVLSAISSRLTTADKEQLKEAIHETDLTLLIKQVKAAPTASLLGKLTSPGFTNVVARHLPTLRVRQSVYAFVLNEYGEACNSYYLRSGSDFHRQEALKAHEESARLSPQYIVPLYRLYEMADEGSPIRQARLEEIVDIDPDWPDAILALAEVRARLARDRSRDAAADKLKASKLAEEAKAEEEKLKAEATTSEQSPDAIDTPQNQLIQDPRLVRSIHAGASAAVPDVKIGKDLRKEIEDKNQVRDLEKTAAKHQEEKRILAKQAVDGVRKLLPFSWAEGPLNEELQQAANNSPSDNGSSWNWFKRRRHNSVGKQIVALLADKNIRWERDLDDIHVRALITWATIRPFLAGSEEVEQVNGRITLRGEELLCHIRHHFWPDDFDLHKTLRDLSKPIAAWEQLPGPDERKLKDFLATSYGAKWLRRASLTRAESAEEFALAKRRRRLTLKLDEQQSRATVVISGIRIEVNDNERYLEADEPPKVCWSNVPGRDEVQMRLMLQRRLGAGWLRKASLSKNSDESLLEMTCGERKLSLRLPAGDPTKGLITHEFKVEHTGAQRNIRYFEYERESNEVMRDAIIRAWEGDRGSFVFLSWVTDPSIDREERHRIFTSVSKEDDLPSSVYKWLGQQWFSESAAGFAEFREALASQDQPLAAGAIHRAKNSIDHGLLVYRKAMEVSRGE